MAHHSLGFRYARGFLFAHSALMNAIGRGPNIAYEFFFEIQTSGAKPWELYHRLPPWRLFYNVADFSDPQHIGWVHSLGTEMSFPLVRNRRFYLGITGALGLGYVTKPYHPVYNNINAAVSAPVNYLLRPGLELAWQMHPQVALLGGLTFTHWSVGALTMPNLGMNIPAFSWGMRAGWNSRNLNAAPPPTFQRPPWQLEALLMGGLKQVYPIGSGFYPTATLGLWIYRQFTPKSGFPAGLDVFWDESAKMRMYRKYHSYGYTLHTFRAGLFAGYEFVINRFSLYFHFGGYFFWPDRLDTRFYQRIGMRYRLRERGILNFSLKSHFFVADFVELGGGIRIAKFPKGKHLRSTKKP
ncbi:MAG: hypothetical protein N2110_07060 [Flavobacteriales bacterium]|nr:hypothetical protein [Flavobacteriales bacterium]MCX7768762.1 hypothetical protein [Flavobacteriales bacterium]MDW8409444.1 hypothetical protein [Flavobacteriales bacterium]